MNIKVREKDNLIIMEIEGNVDINASELIETVGWALSEKSADILWDFEGVNLVDYVGISVLAVAYKNVLNHQGRLKLCAVPAHVSKLFTVVGLDRVFECYDSEETAIISFHEDKAINDIMGEKLRRRFKRIRLHHDIEYRPQNLPGNTFFKGKILNLSAIGLFVVVNDVFPMGEIIQARLYILNEGFLEVKAKVVWLADQEIQLLESAGMGLEFFDIDTTVQERIIEFVEKNLSSLEDKEV